MGEEVGTVTDDDRAGPLAPLGLVSGQGVGELYVFDALAVEAG